MKAVRNSFLGAVLTVALVSAGCGPATPNGLNMNSLTSGTSLGAGSGGLGGGSSGKADLWAKVDTEGFVAGGPFDSAQTIWIDKTNNLLVFSIPLPVNPLGAGISYDIPEFPGASVSVTQTASGIWSLNLNVPLKYLIKNFQFSNPATLPNGDALPAIPGGELPRIAGHIQNTKVNLYLYGSVKYFAVFVPTPGLNPYVNLTFPIKNRSQTKIIGYLATVAQKAGYDGGFYATMILPPELARIIDSL